MLTATIEDPFESNSVLLYDLKALVGGGAEEGVGECGRRG